MLYIFSINRIKLAVRKSKATDNLEEVEYSEVRRDKHPKTTVTLSVKGSRQRKQPTNRASSANKRTNHLLRTHTAALGHWNSQQAEP